MPSGITFGSSENRPVRTRSRRAIKKWLISCRKTPGKNTKEKRPKARLGLLVNINKIACIWRCSQRCAARNNASSAHHSHQAGQQRGILLFPCGLDNFDEFSLQAGPAHQRAVNIRLTKEFFRIGAINRPAVQYPRSLGQGCP